MCLFFRVQALSGAASGLELCSTTIAHRRNLQRLRDEQAGLRKAFATAHCDRLRRGGRFRGGRILAVTEDAPHHHALASTAVSPGVVLVGYDEEDSDNDGDTAPFCCCWWPTAAAAPRDQRQPLLLQQQHQRDTTPPPSPERLLGSIVAQRLFRGNMCVAKAAVDEEKYI